jgi:acyl-CoA synthetase (AMP-forming)/AMP-acid ligase II
MPGIISSVSYQPADVSRPVLETTVGGVLREAAELAAGAVALVEGTPDPAGRRRWSYADLLSASEGVARALLGRFAPGERVAVWAANSPEWLLVEFGAALAGLTLVTVNPALRAPEVAHVLAQSGAHGLVLAPAYRGADLPGVLAQVRGQLPGLREVISLADWDDFVRSGSPAERLPEVRPDDDAQIQYTSGTTGRPKGAVLRHRGITNNARFCTQILQGGPGEVWVNPMPLFHTAGCVLLTLGPVQGQFTQVLPPGFDPGLVLHLIESERATNFAGVPTMLLAQLDHPDLPGRDLSSVRCGFGGGATFPPALVRRVESTFGVPFSIVYGQTESSPVITQTRPDDSAADRAETLGRPHSQVEVQITDPATGQTLPAGATGEILTRGYHVMKEYFANPAATDQAVDAAGWLHTGDLGSMDERGYCRIEGRLKEMIIRGGENIYPREIEQLLYAHPGVADVAIVGVADDYWGEQVAAFVRLAPGSSVGQEELASYCRASLAPHKTPRHWVFVNAFPLTPSGKVQKFALREQFTSGATQAAHPRHAGSARPQHPASERGWTAVRR